MLGALPLALPEYATPGLVQPNGYSILFGHSHFRGGFVQQCPRASFIGQAAQDFIDQVQLQPIREQGTNFGENS